MTPAISPSQKVSAASASVPQISFLIPMYNGLDFTRACVESLSQTVDLTPHEVILINDASTDGTAAFLATLAAPFRAINNPQRSSYAANMNRAAALARGETLCLLNNDLVFRPGWLPPMLEALDHCKNAGVIGNVQINPRTGRYDHIGVVFNRRGAPLHFGRYFFFRPFRGITEWKAVTAACCLVKKSVFLAVGGFHEAYRNGCEDMDFCLTLGRMGYRHYVANDSIVAHHVSSSEDRHRFNTDNEELLRQRWGAQVAQSLTPSDRRRFAVNYVLRFLTQPWRYNGLKLLDALLTLLKCGH